ncbi:tryptophan synthase subunit alpha [Actinokineospora bangkokensis]|uniref:tryptophan synthase n=1 Tax=Actinokineospora bangkokensis TaxID=1193682 RepID=A0A1Q9LC53_9PSEU|nr:tryptophan synthase subunit alpha [Actinokineospora bangkokensis]OLR89585.1 tryptophan synthase subunit alpha [Actinokineospora bangkokensis]
MAEFFAGRGPADPGLAVFLTAGAQPLDLQADLVEVLDAAGVDCLELAVPFPGSPTDGPVLRAAADRALAAGTDLARVLAFVAAVRPRLRRTRIALLADWRHTAHPVGEEEFTRRAAGAGADALLVHGLPPRRRERQESAAREVGIPLVGTCYATSAPEVVAASAATAGAYLYLVAHRGRTGSAPAGGHAALAGAVAAARAVARVPVAVGFGVRTGADVRAVAEAGADAAVVGTAAEQVLRRARDPLRGFDEFVRSLVVGAREPQGGART